MALTEDQKIAIQADRDRLEAKHSELSDTRNEILDVMDCADRILEDNPMESGLKTPMSDARIEQFRVHVTTKTAMLAPTDPV